MSAVTLIREAAKSGVWVGLNGGNHALLAKLKANKAEIVALLRQAACARDACRLSRRFRKKNGSA